MPENTLASVILRYVSRKVAVGSGPASPGGIPVDEPFLQLGTVLEVLGDGRLLVSLGARSVVATPVTDEPYEAGQEVWVSPSSEGYIAHGGNR